MLQGHIYRIIHLQSDIQYVGSTFNESRMRWQQHKSDFKRFSKGKSNCITIYPYFEEHGIEQFKLLLIKTYEVCDRAHLRAYEQLWINKLNCVNKINPFRIDWVSKKVHDAQKKKYRAENKDDILLRQRQGYDSNKEKIKAYRAIKVVCGCGCEITRYSLSQHKKTLKHKKLLSAN
jgi:hypothetical protein